VPSFILSCPKRFELKGPLRAMKSISCSQRNDGYGMDSGPSRGGNCRGAIRPYEMFRVV
jgi:hypothetical protein